jgi:hypothetical protein
MFFTLANTVLLIGGAIGFYLQGKPWAAQTWLFYGLANVGWFMIARGHQ